MTYFRALRFGDLLLSVVAYMFVAAAVLGGFLSPWTLLGSAGASRPEELPRAVWRAG